MPMRLAFSYSIPLATTSTVGTRPDPFGETVVRLVATADCYVTIGTNPVATSATSSLIRSSQAGEFFTIGNGEQIAVIAAAAGGSLNITEMTE